MDHKMTSTSHFRLNGQRVYVAGHTGMVGSAIVRRLGQEVCEILTVDHRELDLTQQRATEISLAAARPHVVVVAAGRVGGIVARRVWRRRQLECQQIQPETFECALDPRDVKRIFMAVQQQIVGARRECTYPTSAS
jgi:nucleoside-diphosphate-sugar epimerase